MPKFKKGQGYWLGKKRPKFSKEWLEKIRLANNGFKKGKASFPAWNKGKSHLVGEKNPSYKDGRTPLVERIRHCFKYRQWRSDVFTRDNFICVLCGYSKGRILNADHNPKLFIEIFNQYNIKTFQEALDCEEFWSINNGRTLCKPCHEKYGRTK